MTGKELRNMKEKTLENLKKNCVFCILLKKF